MVLDYKRYPPRPTTYKGIRMRSRLEATWAAFYDQEVARGDWITGWRHEPMCFANETGQYLPDFKLFYPNPVNDTYVEHKPVVEDPLPLMQLMEIILASEPEALLQISVGPPDDEKDGWYTQRAHPLEWFSWFDGKDVVREVPSPAWFSAFQNDPRSLELFHSCNWGALSALEASYRARP